MRGRLSRREWRASNLPLHDPHIAQVEDLHPPFLHGCVVPGRRQPPSAPAAAVVVVVSAKVVVLIVLGGGGITPRTLASSSDVVIVIRSARMATASRPASDLTKLELLHRMTTRAVAFDFASRLATVIMAVILVRSGGRCSPCCCHIVIVGGGDGGIHAHVERPIGLPREPP
jgi:hypothetical protein